LRKRTTSSRVLGSTTPNSPAQPVEGGIGPGVGTAKAARLAERLKGDGAFLSRSDLRDLGLGRRAVDAVFGALPVVEFPGYSRPLIRVEDYRTLVDESTYGKNQVRPCGQRRRR